MFGPMLSWSPVANTPPPASMNRAISASSRPSPGRRDHQAVAAGGGRGDAVAAVIADQPEDVEIEQVESTAAGWSRNRILDGAGVVSVPRCALVT